MKISLDLAKLQLAENNFFLKKQSFSLEWVLKIEKYCMSAQLRESPIFSKSSCFSNNSL